jgi:rfaE bifunctional protein nucleotidyltransferase chain/domain
LATTLRAKGKRIVSVNGSFDVLHAGHLHILNEARNSGDILIVGLNSDASVRAYKGPNRPLVPEQQRAEMLLALRVVDYVHIFDEPNPIAFLKELNPDVHVNGAEYGENCIESETVKRGGGRIHLVDRVPGLSTSRLVDMLEGSRVAVTS